MLPPVPLVLFNPQCKTPLKEPPKPLSLDSQGQGCSHPTIPTDIFPLFNAASRMDTPLPAPRAAPTPLLPTTPQLLWHIPEGQNGCPGLPLAPLGAATLSPPLAAVLSWPGNHCKWPRRGNEFPGPSATKPEKLIMELY